MASEKEIEARFWEAIRSDRTVMLGLPGSDDGLGQPMTALLEDDAERGPIWIFSAKDVDLVRSLGGRGPAVLHFAAKGHGLFAAVAGTLIADNDRAMIDKLWNPFVAAWYEGGKDDPKLQLLRFEPAHARIWLNESSLFAGIKLLLGADPKEDYDGKIADVQLS